VAASNPPLIALSTENHGFRFEGIPQQEFARKSPPEPEFPANLTSGIPAITVADQSLPITSRTTDSKSHDAVLSPTPAEAPRNFPRQSAASRQPTSADAGQYLQRQGDALGDYQ
jgi:hypothetical protein